MLQIEAPAPLIGRRLYPGPYGIMLNHELVSNVVAFSDACHMGACRARPVPSCPLPFVVPPCLSRRALPVLSRRARPVPFPPVSRASLPVASRPACPVTSRPSHPLEPVTPPCTSRRTLPIPSPRARRSYLPVASRPARPVASRPSRLISSRPSRLPARRVTPCPSHRVAPVSPPCPSRADPTTAYIDCFACQRAALTTWKSRDAAAYIALTSLLPESEETHFAQGRTGSEFLTTIKALYTTPTTVSLGRLFLPFLFPHLASLERSAALIAHLCSLDSSYRAACTDAQLALLPPHMAITIYFITTSLPDRLASVRDALLLKHPSELTIGVLESALKDVESNLRSVASASGAMPPPLFHGCTVPQLPTFTASLATAATDVTAAAVTTSARSRVWSGTRGGHGAGGSRGNGGGIAGGGGGSAGVGGAPGAASSDSSAFDCCRLSGGPV
ncbi:unnamed protein product [Closterium sp. NIES-54]